MIKKVFRWIKTYGLVVTICRINAKLTGRPFNVNNTKKISYDSWRKKYEITEKVLQEQRKTKLDKMPLFSIVLPIDNANKLYPKEIWKSLENQTYTNWEANIAENFNLAIKMAKGDYLVFADVEDRLSLNALFECAFCLNEDETIEFIYSDEDKMSKDGDKLMEPHFKSDYNLDLLCSMNYIGRFFVVRRDLVERVGGVRDEFKEAKLYDLILRCCEKAKNIKHISQILYHASSVDENYENGKRVLDTFFKWKGLPAHVERGAGVNIYKTVYDWKEQPLISIIIPNKDHVSDLKKCMDSIEAKSTYRNFEFIVVENNSIEKETFAYYDSIQDKDNVRVLLYDGEFNYSRINNMGVRYAKGDYLLLLNNDTEIINPDCLKEMLGYCMREDVGIVGARLFYPDDTIQHAGVVLGFGGSAGHTFVGLAKNDEGYFSRLVCAQDYSAVTAACMMTKKVVYEKVGGLTEEYKVAFNDIDYCMKVREQGYLVVYNPAAELYHYESKSRGFENSKEKRARFSSEVELFNNTWGEIVKLGDPYYNSNLSLIRSDFGLRE